MCSLSGWVGLAGVDKDEHLYLKHRVQSHWTTGGKNRKEKNRTEKRPEWNVELHIACNNNNPNGYNLIQAFYVQVPCMCCLSLSLKLYEVGTTIKLHKRWGDWSLIENLNSLTEVRNHKSWRSFQLYYFPIVAVTNYHQFSGLPQHKYFSYGDKIKVSVVHGCKVPFTWEVTYSQVWDIGTQTSLGAIILTATSTLINCFNQNRRLLLISLQSLFPSSLTPLPWFILQPELTTYNIPATLHASHLPPGDCPLLKYLPLPH